MDDCQVKREKQIPSELNKLNKALDDLQQAVGGLEEGLSQVSRSPQPASEACPPDSNPGCELADEIAGHRRRVEGLVASTRELKDRLEI